MSLLRKIFGRPGGEASAAVGKADRSDAGAVADWVREGYDAQVHGDREAALRLFHRVLEHAPEHPDALFFLGAVAGEDHREAEAIHYLQRAVEARPGDVDFRFALGSELFNAKRFDEAREAFLAAVRLQPDHEDAEGNLFMALLESGREEDARQAVEAAIQRGRDDAYTQVTLASIYRNQGRVDDSIAASRRLLAGTPDHAPAHSDLLMTLNYSDAVGARQIYEEHRRYAAQFARPYLPPPLDRAWPRRLRVGYVSPDFRAHVVALFFEPIMELRDRSRFEVFCYYNSRRDDEFTARFRAMSDHWLDCVHLSDAELADRIRADRIDLLVDLAGHTGHNRLGVFAMKPAPVQVTYLGYPNTTGLKAIDYRISDARADPPGDADRMSAESIVRLPDCFHTFRPGADVPSVGPLPALASGQLTFGCFNNFSKLSGTFLDAAARVLKAVPGSRLWLKGKPLGIQYVAEGVRRRFEAAGIGAERLVLTGWRETLNHHLDAYNEVDIALDSFPYNGTTTTCEALWMGVPVVTLLGDRHAARVGHSLLHAVGLEALVARDMEQFVAHCVRLASDLPALADLRASLRGRVESSPLRDEARLTRSLEAAYLQMWESKLREEGASRGRAESGSAGLLERADAERAAGRKPEALALYEEVLAALPGQPRAVEAIWDLSFETGNPGAAIDWLNRAIAADPVKPEFHYMLGCSFQAQAKEAYAVACFRRAIELHPGYAKAHNNLGCMLEAAGELEQALAAYERASTLDARLAVAWYNAGNALRRMGEPARAIRAIRRAIAIEPDHADWQSNLADLLYAELELDEALACYHRALQLDPSLALARQGRGLALAALGRTEEAVADFRQVLDKDPLDHRARSNLLFALHAEQAEDRERMFREHLAWDARHARLAWRSARTAEERAERRRLRVGYVSPDFWGHPVASFFEPLLEAHDRSRFEVFCYATSTRRDATTGRIEAGAEHWRLMAGRNDEQLAERVRFDGIDILVDLAGHTGGGRLRAFAMKPAPIQVTWLGYPNTSGLRAMDYRLTDDIADPAGEAREYCTEKLIRLADGFLCYRPPEDAPAVGALPAERSGTVTFGSFNHLSKLSARTIELWSRLLASVPGSRLVLKAYGLAAESARERIAARFAELGIAAGRLVLLPPESGRAAHLARYGEIDVALDTFPYAGTTTTCEALWMGVPVVTMAGRSHASRVGASILKRVGLGELCAADESQYLRIARELAADRERLRALRAGLRERLKRSPLLDARRFAAQVESAYEAMWAGFAQGTDEILRLHIGGLHKMEGWKILNVQPGPAVDFVGDCSDLTRFADGSVAEIYASHVVEHLGYQEALPKTLREFWRVLRPGGTARIAVPDFERLCKLFLDPLRTPQERMLIMQMAFGGQSDPHDFHYVGLTFEFIDQFLRDAGFTRVERVDDFGLLHDDSTIRLAGVPISLNVVAHK